MSTDRLEQSQQADENQLDRSRYILIGSHSKNNLVDEGILHVLELQIQKCRPICTGSAAQMASMLRGCRK